MQIDSSVAPRPVTSAAPGAMPPERTSGDGVAAMPSLPGYRIRRFGAGGGNGALSAGTEIAIHTKYDVGMSVAGSPSGIGAELWTPNDHAKVTVTGIDSVWKGGRNAGWVYADRIDRTIFKRTISTVRKSMPKSIWDNSLANGLTKFR